MVVPPLFCLKVLERETLGLDLDGIRQSFHAGGGESLAVVGRVVCQVFRIGLERLRSRFFMVAVKMLSFNHLPFALHTFWCNPELLMNAV